MHRTLVLTLTCLALTACTRSKDTEAPASDERTSAPARTPPVPPQAPPPPGAQSQAGAPAPTEAQAQSEAAKRISGSISFSGFGPARFGANEEAVRQAWGRGLEDGPRAEGSTCRYLFFPAERGGEPFRIGFMLEDGRFVRLDVKTAEYVAPGGGRIGMDAGDIRSRYAGRIEELPHKYVEGGRYLIVSPEGGGQARLIFETDASGKVTEWRVGLPPQVQYVEGCS